MPLMAAEIFGGGLPSSQSGSWMKVESTVRKVAGFFLLLDPGVTVLDGADVSSRTLTSFIFPEIATGGDRFTQLYIVNPQASSNQLTLDLISADGSVRARADRTIAANGTMGESVTQLFSGVTPELSDYVRARATLGVVAFEYLGRNARFVQGLNGQGAASGATALYSPQYVLGGQALTSTLSVVNLDDTSGAVTFRFVGDDGAVIATQQRPIGPRGKLLIADESFSSTLVDQVTGYLEILSSGPRLAGSVVFGDQARSTFSSALPLVVDLRSDMIFAQLASAPGSSPPWFTGLALLNPGSTDANARVQVFDPNGAAVTSGTFVISAGRRRSQLLTEYFPELVGRDILGGYIRVTTDQPLASFVLFGTGTLSVLSAVPPQLVP
jgi:hypothetical protein